jgi:hypothetical protein
VKRALCQFLLDRQPRHCWQTNENLKLQA